MGFFSIDNMQRGKQAVHIAQAIFIFVSWCLMIAVFRNARLIFGGPAWFFTLCFLSIPPIIYQTLTPIWERSRKWANPYAFAILDVIYSVLWLSAFASVAAYNSTGACLGACDVSKACVGLGFFIFLFFCLTSAMSIYGVIYFRREGVLPGATRVFSSNAAMIDPDREAFSTAPHDDEYAPVHTNDKHQHHGAADDDDSYDDNNNNMHHEMDGGESSVSHHSTYDPTALYGSGRGADAGTAYNNANRLMMGRSSAVPAGGGRVVYAPPSVSDVAADAAGSGAPGYRRYTEDDLEHGGYDGAAGAGRVRFPAGNY